MKVLLPAEAAMRNSEIEYRTLLEQVPGIFYAARLDEIGSTFYVSKRIEQLGFSQAEWLEDPALWSKQLHPDDRERVLAEYTRAYTNSEPFRSEYRLLARDGKAVWFHDESVIVCDPAGQPLYVQGLMMDITERKRAEEALQSAYDEMEQKVIERTRELTEANIKLKELDRLKAEFLATMSHELRTPLNSIIGFTGMILQGMAGGINEEQKKQLSMVYNSAKRLLSLINDILDLSRIESGKVDVSMSGFKVDEVVSEVVRSLDPMVYRKGLRLVTEVPDEIPEIWSDRRKFFQILLNLVNNAVKFTDKGEVRIACKTDHDNLEVSVSDTGIGIKKENMNLLFEAFRQVDGTSRRRYEGTGLGLYLCKKLLDLLGGQIWVESEFGKGSRFTFTLPLGPKVRE